MDDVIVIADLETFKKRSYMLLFTLPKIFLCGFFWQAFSYATNASTTSPSFYFITGFGSGLGAFVGTLLFSVEIVEGSLTLTRLDVFHSVAYFFAIFLGSGTTWQKIVNDTQDYDMNFTTAFFYMWLLASVLFCSALTVLRHLHTLFVTAVRKQDKWDDVESVYQRFYFDVQLSLCVGIADAFFVGTVSGYEGNWLSFFGTEGVPKAEAMAKAGASTLVGFTLLCVLQNVFLKYCWLDRVEKALTPVNSSVGLNAASVQQAVGSPFQDAI
ncbi:hypothetical protein B484DRAFT_458016 [Ochromonadaceae sp. CCMP2298]|nr:hypothetical protein B484DRAFT_458016 [Ochromonadaceae sp. CCMP2298]|mmetsp:Transcript_25496/g.57613  ORF Transcript_25496/g.57613 Transcript_25496/m.57613 type:complete len:270 (+) Transcript_25496:202-1011(+)|eukprot:CAMPEP_0173172264 /NCGR_PEP_ID=MMETSP1141-20130122/2214_1 /TAXON_ID=483371 /ORGANISM="non described non described, Strain CCMP2298" /LENGTH=269 /DNA_ID=CAMNT_0014094285 /DNA_START=103 /DNA_END=912 /DNA_ORIENTATION=-